MADETTQGAHPFTVDWWRSLPGVYRAADRVQGHRSEDFWWGFNRDPRFITGWDKWRETNVSNRAWQSTMDFTRTFRVAPHVPVHIRSWHAPVVENTDGSFSTHLDGTEVRHIVRNHTGDVVINDSPMDGLDPWSETYDGAGVTSNIDLIYDGGTVTAVVAPSGDESGVTDPDADLAPEEPVLAAGTRVFGVVASHTVTSADWLIHHSLVVPDRFGVIQVTVQVSVDVPDARDFMAAVHVSDRDATFEDLPTRADFLIAGAYPLLRYMDGIGHQAGFLSDTANDMHEGAWTDPVTAPESVLPFLAVVLGLPPKYTRTLTRQKLREHLVSLVEGRSPAPGSREHIAITAQNWLTGSKQVSVTPAHAVEGYEGPDPLHTLVITVRKDEVPNNDLVTFARFLNDSGVIPAGHLVFCRESDQSWDAWQQAMGPTWATHEAASPTWNRHDSAGVSLDYTEGNTP